MQRSTLIRLGAVAFAIATAAHWYVRMFTPWRRARRATREDAEGLPEGERGEGL